MLVWGDLWVLQKRQGMVLVGETCAGIGWTVLLVRLVRSGYEDSLVFERLSVRLLFLQCVFSVGGIQFLTLQGCNLPRFGNAMKGVACAQTSVPLRNAIKIPCLQKVWYTYVILLFSAL